MKWVNLAIAAALIVVGFFTLELGIGAILILAGIGIGVTAFGKDKSVGSNLLTVGKSH